MINQSPTQSQEGANSPDIKEEDDGSEDESDERMDQRMDPERLKAFNVSLNYLFMKVQVKIFLIFLKQNRCL